MCQIKEMYTIVVTIVFHIYGCCESYGNHHASISYSEDISVVPSSIHIVYYIYILEKHVTLNMYIFLNK